MIWEKIQQIEKFITNESEVLFTLTILILYFTSDAIFPAINRYILNDTSQTAHPIIAALSVILILIASCLALVSRDKYINNKKLEADLNNRIESERQKSSDIREIIDFIISYIGKDKLGMGRRSRNTERISLYVHDERGFYPQSRYSANPELARIRRPRYPPNQGAIGFAWEHQEYFQKYPDVTSEPDEYYRLLEEREHIPREEAEQLSMKPQLIYGKRIDDNHDAIAVIIVEALEPDRYQRSQLQSVFRGADVKICIDILRRVGLPDPTIGSKWEDQ